MGHLLVCWGLQPPLREGEGGRARQALEAGVHLQMAAPPAIQGARPGLPVPGCMVARWRGFPDSR